MKRIFTGLILALPIVVATSLPKPASALLATTNPQLPRAVDQPEYIAQYDGRYQRSDQGRYREEDRERDQRRRAWVNRHYEYGRDHIRVFVPGHYIYR